MDLQLDPTHGGFRTTFPLDIENDVDGNWVVSEETQLLSRWYLDIVFLSDEGMVR